MANQLLKKKRSIIDFSREGSGPGKKWDTQANFAEPQIVDVTEQAGFKYKFGKMPTVNGLVVHHTGGRGSVDGVLSTFKQRNYPAQYVMDRDGKIYQALPGDAQGQHIKPGQGAGKGLSNRNALGIEVIAKDNDDWTDAQKNAMAGFTLSMAKKHNFDPVKNLYGHGQINPHKQANEGLAFVDWFKENQGKLPQGTQVTQANNALMPAPAGNPPQQVAANVPSPVQEPISSPLVEPQPTRNSLLPQVGSLRGAVSSRMAQAFPNGVTGLRGIVSDPNWQPSGLTRGLFGSTSPQAVNQASRPREMVISPAGAGSNGQAVIPSPGEPDAIETKALPDLRGPSPTVAPAGQTAVEKELALPEQEPSAVEVPEPSGAAVVEPPPVPAPVQTPAPIQTGVAPTFDEAFKEFSAETSAPAPNAPQAPVSEFDRALQEEFNAPETAQPVAQPTVNDPSLMEFYTPPTRTGRGDNSRAIDFARRAADKDGVAQPGVLQTPDGKMSWESEKAKQDYYMNQTKALTGSQYFANAVGLGMPQALFGNEETKRQLENYETQQPGTSFAVNALAPIMPVAGLYGAGAKGVAMAARGLANAIPRAAPAVNALGKFASGNAGVDMAGGMGRAMRGGSYMASGAIEGAASGALMSQLSDSDLETDAATGAAVYTAAKTIGGPMARAFTNPAMKAAGTAQPGMVDNITEAAPYFSEKTLPRGGQISTDPLTQRVDYNLNAAANKEQLDSWTADLAKHIDMKEPYVTKKTLGDHEAKVGLKLDEIAKKGGIVPHVQIFDDFKKLRSEAQSEFKIGEDSNGNPLIGTDGVYILNEIDKLEAALKSGAIDGAQFRAQTDRSSVIGRMISSSNSHHKFYGSKLRDTLEAGFAHTAKQSGIPELPGELKKTLQQYRNTQVLFDAASKSGESGIVGPKEFKDAFTSNYSTKYVPNKNNPISYGLNIADVLPDVTNTGAAVGKNVPHHPDNPTLAMANRGAAPTIRGYGNSYFDTAKQWASPALLAAGGAYGMGAGNLGTLGLFAGAAGATYGMDKMRDSAIAEIMRTPQYRNLIMGMGKRSDIPTTNTERKLRGIGNALMPAATAAMGYNRGRE